MCEACNFPDDVRRRRRQKAEAKRKRQAQARAKADRGWDSRRRNRA